MKTLILLRHAKTEQPYSGQKDFDRELLGVGISDAIHKGNFLAQKAERIDVIISSPSKRTTQTTELVAEKMGYTFSKVVFNEAVYMASARTLLDVINHIDDKFEKAMLVGHNPGITYIAEYLTGADIGHVPTSGVVCVTFELSSWKEISKNSGSIAFMDFSKSNK